MRTYPNNSPQAAARIVALAMLADAQVCKAEIDVLDRLRAHEELGLRPDELHSIVHSMCDDMLSTAEMSWADACQVDPQTLAARELENFLAAWDLPVLTRLHDAQVYVQCAAAGASLFDLPRSRAMPEIERWEPLQRWIAQHL